MEISGYKPITGGTYGAGNISAPGKGCNGCGCTGEAGGAGETGEKDDSKEKENEEKAQELAKEHDLATLQEAEKLKGPGANLMNTDEGKENKEAEEIADKNDKEVIEKAVEIKQQEEAKKEQMQQKMMRNMVTLSPDAIGGMGGNTPFPQGDALRAFGGF